METKSLKPATSYKGEYRYHCELLVCVDAAQAKAFVSMSWGTHHQGRYAWDGTIRPASRCISCAGTVVDSRRPASI